MPSMKQVLVGVLGLGLTVTGLSFALPAAPAQAVGGVFISEIHYDNTGTDSGEFVEVTAAAGTDLSTYSIVLYNAGGTIPGQSYDTDALSGTVTDQQDGWGTGVLSYPSNGVQNGAPDGVALVNNGTLVEFLSYEGSFSATNGPANGIASTDIGVLEVGTEPTGLSLQRLENNTWTGPAAHTSGTPNGYDTGGEPPALAATAEPDAEAIVNEPMTPVVLDATGGTPPYTWTTASTLPAGVTLSTAGELSGTPTETGTFPITATVTDDEDATDDVSFTLTVSEPAGLITIAEVQGTDSAASPLDGQDVLVEGVVTGVYADPYDAEPGMSNYGGLDGFYLQTAGTGGTSDATPGASDAVFVYTGNDVPAGIAVGDSVEVDGTVDEFGGLTEIVSPTVTETDTPLTAVNPLEIAYPATSAEREAQEGMLLAPTGMFTVTNSFATNQFGEVGLATGDEPLKQPTEYERPSDTAALQAIKDENAARAVVLDDGTSINYFTNGSAQQDFPLPWLTPATPVRVGAEATLVAPVLLDYRNNAWKFQPQEPVLDAGTDVATFEDTRAQNAQPQEVGGDLKIATFNVLNYFPTTGEEWVAAGDGRTCTFFTDRDANPIGNNRCEPNGPRGAANQVNFERQQAKIVAAINGLDADIVGLEELENSIQMPGASGRDDAAAALVAALNAEAGAGTWDYVPSPAEASTPEAVAEQDVIRGGFIYKPATVELVGESALLLGTTEFTNAREPLGQAFKAAGASDFEAFVVIVNHFKSKGDSNPPATGDNANNPDTGAFNGDRVRQANRLVTFANEFAAARGTDRIFLAGDFNSYTHEDPMHVLYDAGFEPVESDQASDESYSFSGLSGSLDHVLASPAASELVTGADIWEINANESVAYQYSRYNYNVTNLYVANQFAASDHNPEIVGIAVPDLLAPSVTAPDRRIKSHRDAQIPVTVTADGVVPTGEVSLSHGGTELGCVLLESDGSAVVTIPAGSLAARKAPYELTIAYSGDASVAPGTGSVTVTVKGPRR